MTSTQVCVHCGVQVNSIYKKYNSDNPKYSNSDGLKLMRCQQCLSIADKYVEYDVVIILIDLILFKREPYRHIIYNTPFKNHWKLWLVIFLLKTYVLWNTPPTPRTDEPSSHSYIMVPEHAFYLSALATAIGHVAFLCVITLGVKSDSTIRRRASGDVRLLLLWKALVLSEIGQFLLLPSLVWTDQQRTIHYTVVIIYVLVSKIQALSVVTETPRPMLLQLLILAFIVETNIIKYGRDFLQRKLF